MTRTSFTVAIAPDSFKGSVTAAEAAACIETGLKKALKNIRVRCIPMADGGEGTVQAIVDATSGHLVRRTVRDPLGRSIKAKFGITGDGRTAVIEMAEASGLVLLKPRERNPLKTTTAGTGDLIRHALSLDVRKILIGIGGSATNDGGTGMARALGVKFTDSRGCELKDGGGALNDLHAIDATSCDTRLDRVDIEVACDVNNPLTGKKGASHVYGPQKGATLSMVKSLDENLGRLASVVKRDLGKDISRVPGAGAAGGLGGGLMAFTGATLRPGVEMVIETVGLKKRLKGCDLVITGEGCMDGQTAFGKAPAGVARVAGDLGIPTIAICGSLGDGVEAVHDIGIAAYFSALTEPIPEAQLERKGPGMLVSCAKEVGRLIGLRLLAGDPAVRLSHSRRDSRTR